MPSKEFKDMTVEEQNDYVKQLNAQVEHKDDEHKTAMDEKEKENKDAMDEKDKENKNAVKTAMDEEKKNHDARMAKLSAAILKAMDEKDEDKRKEAIKQAMEDDKKENMAQDDKDKKNNEAQYKDDEEKKALKATVTYLEAQINKPKIDYLSKIYTAAKVDEKTLKEYEADWNKMGAKQLDAAIEKVKPLIESIPEFSAGKIEQQTPFGFSSPDIPTELSADVNDKSFKKIDDMSDAELFEQGGPYV